MPTSAFDNKKPQRFPVAAQLLKAHHITVRQIVCATGLQGNTVRRAFRGERVQPANLRFIKAQSEQLLRAANCEFSANEIWSESTPAVQSNPRSSGAQPCV